MRSRVYTIAAPGTVVIRHAWPILWVHCTADCTIRTEHGDLVVPAGANAPTLSGRLVRLEAVDFAAAGTLTIWMDP